MLKRKIKAYCSGPIRGVSGVLATPDEIQNNLDKGILWGKHLWMFFGPNLDIYLPHNQDTFPQTAMDMGYLTVNQVLAVDCAIVSQCDIVIVMSWENHISTGMQREIDKAKELDIPIYFLEGVDEVNLEELRVWLEQL